MTLPNSISTRERGAAHAHDPHRLAGWLIVMALAANGCRSTPPDEHRVPLAEPPAPAVPPSSPTPSAAGKPTRGPTAMIDVAGKSLLVTTADAGVLQTLLLARIEASQLELRDYLRQAAQGDINVQPTSVTIGRWTLRDYNGRLSLYHRGPAPAVFHAAEVAGSTGSWTVQEPTRGEILMRPRP